MRLRTILTAAAGLLVFASSAHAAVTFTGDFETGDLSQWDLVQACPDDATVYSSASEPDWPAPVDGAYALRLSVADSHVLSGATMNCDALAGNPRGQLLGNRSGEQSLQPGDDKWESWWVQFPADFPVVSGRNWFVMQQDYGAPFAGSPPVAFDIKDDGTGANRFVMDVCPDGCWATATAWAGPTIQPGHWYHFVVHKVFSTSDDTGTVEIWLDGEPQTFVDGSTSYHTRTLHANCTCASTNAYRFYLNNYHADALSPDPVTVYFDGALIGTSREDVDHWVPGTSDSSDSSPASDPPAPSDPGSDPPASSDPASDPPPSSDPASDPPASSDPASDPPASSDPPS
jgi:Polysaccharide lyase